MLGRPWAAAVRCGYFTVLMRRRGVSAPQMPDCGGRFHREPVTLPHFALWPEAGSHTEPCLCLWIGQMALAMS